MGLIQAMATELLERAERSCDSAVWASMSDTILQEQGAPPDAVPDHETSVAGDTRGECSIFHLQAFMNGP